MAYKDVLVHVDDSKACAARVQAAIELAIAHEAHLSGVYVIGDPPPETFERGYLLPEMRDMLQQGARARRRRARPFHRGCQTQPDLVRKPGRSGSVYRDERGSRRQRPLCRCGDSRQADPEHGEAPLYLPEEVTLASGRPSLVIPYVGPAATLGERVTVAWDASRAAARAVNDALPLLKRAQAVTVVTVNASDKPFGHGEQPGADIALHLARHGVKVEVQRIESRDVDVPNIVLSHIADRSSDLLVMGAYGHSRLRELVLGGVTRTILNEMTVPVLMAH